MEDAAGWTESNSELFVDFGRVVTPARDEIRQVLLDLVPAQPEEPFLAVDIADGQGWLSEALLRRFPGAQVVALDGSPTMLRHAGALLAPFGARATLRPF